MSWSTPEARDRGLRRARAASWISLGVFAVVVALNVVLLLDGAAGWWLLLADLLCAVVAIRSIRRLVTISRALREDADD